MDYISPFFRDKTFFSAEQMRCHLLENDAFCYTSKISQDCLLQGIPGAVPTLYRHMFIVLIQSNGMGIARN